MQPVHTFTVALLAQVMSRTGGQMMGFAIGVVLYQRTGSVELNAELAAAILAPEILLSPLGGVAVDTFDRGRVLCIGHLLSAACAAALLGLFAYGSLMPGAVLAIVALGSAARAAELSAWAAATATLVPPSNLGRANGAVQLGLGLTHVFAPALAGALLGRGGLHAILTVALASSLSASAVFGVLHIPRPRPLVTVRPRFLAELTLGTRWVLQRPMLLALLLFLALINSVIGLAEVLITPIVLGFADAETLSLIFALGAVGVLGGGLMVMLRGGPQSRIDGVLLGSMTMGLMCVIGSLKPSVALAAVGVFGAFFSIPFVAASSEAIWQSQVPPAIHGRVFSVRAFAARLPIPLVYLGAGWLADGVFEPLLRVGGALETSVGRFSHVGLGRGSALLLALSGGTLVFVAVLGWLSPRVRGMERSSLAGAQSACPIVV